MKTFTLRLFRDTQRPLRVEQLSAPSLAAAAGEARRRLSASSFCESDVLEGGRIVSRFRRSGRGGEITPVPTPGPGLTPVPPPT